MLSSLAANAVLTKSRAKYGKRLTDRQYIDLINCKSVSEIASYLKSRTKYASCLKGYSPESMHRGFLEVCLRRFLFEEYESLYRYELSLGEKLYNYFTLRTEFEQISNCIRLMIGGNPEDYIFKLPDFFNKHTSLDLYALAEVKTIKDLIKALDHTPYQKVLEPFQNLDNIANYYTAIDSALQNYMYSEIIRDIHRDFHGKTKKALLDMIGIQCDLINISYIYRLKEIFHMDTDSIRPLLLPHGSILGHKDIEYLLSDSGKLDFNTRLEKTGLKKRFADQNHEYIEESCDSVLFNYCTKKMRYSPLPPIVVFSFVILAETEIKNIIHIIEGVRYGASPDEISKLLIGID